MSSSLDAIHRVALGDDARELLAQLGGHPWMDEAYLAGSAALALYLDHRRVFSLDLMTASNRLAAADRRDLLQLLLELDPGFRVETARDGFLYARSGAGVALRWFYYPYPLIEPEREIDGVWVASPLDLGLMKLGAIISRGTRRDFTDLYLLCRALPLDELIGRAPEKFGHVRDFPVQALKALTDFSVAGDGSMGELAAPLDWSTVEHWARNCAVEIGRARFGLPQPGAG